jgi:hypothetical protein
MRAGMEDRLMRKLPLIAMCLFMTAGFGHARAESYVGSLTGVTKIELLIEDLDANNKACGITEEIIRDAFMYPASSSRLQIARDDPSAPFFYIQVTTLHSNVGACASHIHYQLYFHQLVQPVFTPSPRNLDMVFWNEGSIMMSQQNQHAQMVKENVENYTKKFLTKWNFDNKSQ